MRTLAVVGGAVAPRHPDPSPARPGWFLDRLAGLGPLDLVLVHDARSSVDARRAWRRILAPDRVADGFLELDAPPLRRSGLLREVHLHGSADGDRSRRGTEARLRLASFVDTAAGAHDLLWCAGIAALARGTRVRPSIPAAVDIDRSQDLGSTRARRAVRSWACVADLVTVPDPAFRDHLAVPGTLVVDEHGGAPFAQAIAAVLDDARAYRPVRTS